MEVILTDYLQKYKKKDFKCTVDYNHTANSKPIIKNLKKLLYYF